MLSVGLWPTLSMSGPERRSCRGRMACARTRRAPPRAAATQRPARPMDFALADDHELFRRTVREFARGVLMPAARVADESGAFAPEVWRETAAVGLFGLLVPEAHGGAGVDTLGFALALEEV